MVVKRSENDYDKANEDQHKHCSGFYFALWHISMPVTRMFTNYYYDKGTSAAVEEVKTLEEREARDQREGQAMQRANFFGRIWTSSMYCPTGRRSGSC